MNIDINIEGLVADAVAAALAPEKLQPIIQANVEKAVKSAIDDNFGYRSPFVELCKESMAAVMPTDLGDLGRYGDLVLKAVRMALNEHQDHALKQTITERMENLLKPLPARMKLSELVEKLTEHFATGHRREGDKPTFIVEVSDVVEGYWGLYADPKEGADRYSKYGCAIQMQFNKEGECYSLRIDEKEDPKNMLFLGSHHGADALALNLYTGGTKVDFEDIYLDDIYYPDAYRD
ncbi:hypothetical protein [Pseudomonas nitroreducens]|uniref:hypothetical protein n=1 Tax=Pseudomonas nitroreducens TaxID=46680 RepID=UPI003D27E565